MSFSWAPIKSTKRCVLVIFSIRARSISLNCDLVKLTLSGEILPKYTSSAKSSASMSSFRNSASRIVLSSSLLTSSYRDTLLVLKVFDIAV